MRIRGGLSAGFTRLLLSLVMLTSLEVSEQLLAFVLADLASSAVDVLENILQRLLVRETP
jgi:hypothetical protein